MDTSAVGIPICFALISALVLWSVILGKGHWVIKAGLVSVALYFSVVVWMSLSSLSGWATTAQVPENYLIHWLLVEEPSKTDSSKLGVVYLWSTEINKDFTPVKQEVHWTLKPFVAKHNASEPRVYRLPYSQQLHKEAAKAMKMLKQGKMVVGKRGKSGMEAGDGTGNGKGNGQGKGKGKGGQGREGKGKGSGNGSSMSQEQEFMFYELPPFLMQPKEVVDE